MKTFSAKLVRRALSWSATYWGFYAAVDYCFSDTLPPLLRPTQFVHDPEYWNAGLLALLVMLVGGTILGACVGLVWSGAAKNRDAGPSDARLAGGASFSVIAVFAIAVAAHAAPGLAPLRVALTLPVALGAAVSWISLSEDRTRRFWFLINPATLALILIVHHWLYWDVLGNSPLRWTRTPFVLALILNVSISWLCSRISGKRVFSVRWMQYASALVGLVGVAGGFGIRNRQGLIPSVEGSPAAGKPNVILISLDTVRADHLSVYGYERDTTPNLRRFAAESTLYRNAISAANWTAPSHASMFTGMYALRHGVRYDVSSGTLGTLPKAVPTLAEALGRQGYRTAGIVANYLYLSDLLGFNRGFDLYRIPMPWTIFEGRRYPSVVRWIRHRLLPPVSSEPASENAVGITAESLAILDQLADRRPFFLFLNYLDAHWRYAPPEPFRTRFGESSRTFSTQDYSNLWRAVNRGERIITEQEKQDLIAAYDGAIAYVDDQLEILFEALRRAGIYERTLIVVTSDHGEAFGDKAILGHGSSVFQDQVRVPLLIKYPGQRQPAEVTPLVSGVDLYPTVMEAIGATGGRYLAGLPLQRTAGQLARVIFTESYPEWNNWTAFSRFRGTHRAMVRDSWKLILSADGGRELYDLSRDAGENRNLITEQPRVAAEMETVLSAWQRNLAPVNAPAKLGEDLDQLKALGYVQ